MNEEGETEEGLPSGEEEAEEQEPQPEPLYDPLTEPWNDPASTSVVEYRVSEAHHEFAPYVSAAPRYREQPYHGVDELTELRRRLREETAAAPRRGTRWLRSLTVLVGFALLASAVLATYLLASSGATIWDAFTGGGGLWVLGGIAVAMAALLVAAGIAEMVRERQTAAVPTPPGSDVLWGERVQAVAVPKGRPIWAVTLRELAETVLLAILIFFAVHVSMQNFKVEGTSMEPSLDNGEYLIVNKLAYAEIDLSIFDWVPFFDAGDNAVHHLWGSPARGDVIVFLSPTAAPRERDFIKRIIGVPGDTVEIDRETGAVAVNGQVIDEPYIRGTTTCTLSCGPWVVPERSYFVMGDNRNNSSDSRQGWFVPEENIIGKTMITYWDNGGPDLDLAPNHDVSFASEAAAEE
jgi:signal peptidase I